MIKPYLSGIINHHETQFGEWKIELTMKVNFISPEETCTIHTKSDKIKIMMGSETNNVIEKLCEALLKKNRRINESKHVCLR